ncbi:MAG TPA: hypothetical protein VGB30_09665 [bacterium]|jgi:hypothetical protein
MAEENKTEAKKETKQTIEESNKFCPACYAVGEKVNLKIVEGIQQLAENPAQLAGAPRVIECDKGCRYTLEPYWGRKKKVLFCYMCILSETNPAATCNHHFVDPGSIAGFDASKMVTEDGWYSPLKKD